MTDRVVGAVGLGGSRVRTDQTVPYKATLAASKQDKREFTVSSKDVAVPLDELRESLRYSATRYCITTFGGSDIDWTLDAATGDWAVSSDGSSLTVAGRCTSR